MQVNLSSLARAQGIRRQRIVLRPVQPTLGDERELLGIYGDTVRIWLEGIPRIIAAYNASPLTNDADGAQLQWLIDQVERQADDTILYQTEKLGRWVSKVGTRNMGKTISGVKSATGVDIAPYIRLRDVQPYLEQSIRQNVALISNVNADAKRRVEEAVYEAIANRKNKKWLTDRIAKEMGITKRRARIIAGDQTHKLNAALNKYRNEQLGIEAYIWRTMRDESVRAAHEAREGKTFRWSEPPSDGHPGHPINCRCSAAAVLDLEDDDG
jgi:SPP1 gp7 family putative phage head morphogenesis protein